jgi:hypothetical protein
LGMRNEERRRLEGKTSLNYGREIAISIMIRPVPHWLPRQLHNDNKPKKRRDSLPSRSEPTQ